MSTFEDDDFEEDSKGITEKDVRSCISKLRRRKALTTAIDFYICRSHLSLDPLGLQYLEGADVSPSYLLERRERINAEKRREIVNTFYKSSTGFFGKAKVILKEEGVEQEFDLEGFLEYAYNTSLNHSFHDLNSANFPLDSIYDDLGFSEEDFTAEQLKKLNKIQTFEYWKIDRSNTLSVLLDASGYKNMYQIFNGFLTEWSNGTDFDVAASDYFRQKADLSQKQAGKMAAKLSKYARKLSGILELANSHEEE